MEHVADPSTPDPAALATGDRAAVESVVDALIAASPSAAAGQPSTPLLTERVTTEPGDGWLRLQVDICPINGLPPGIDLERLAATLALLFGDCYVDGASLTART